MNLLCLLLKVTKHKSHRVHTVWHKIFAGVYFCGLAIFCVLRELIWQIGFSCWELIFAIFRKYAVPRVDDIFVFIKDVQQKYIFSNNTTVSVPHIHVYKTSISSYNFLILKESNKLYLNRHYFLVLYFCVANST